MHKMIDAEYASGRTTVMGDGELETMLREADFELYNRVAYKSVFNPELHKSREEK